MSRHNRQRNKRHARGLFKVYCDMCQKEPSDGGWWLTSLVELARSRLERTGRFPRYINPVQREAFKRFDHFPSPNG